MASGDMMQNLLSLVPKRRVDAGSERFRRALLLDHWRDPHRSEGLLLRQDEEIHSPLLEIEDGGALRRRRREGYLVLPQINVVS